MNDVQNFVNEADGRSDDGLVGRDIINGIDANTEPTTEVMAALLAAFDSYVEGAVDDADFKARSATFNAALKARNAQVYAAFLNAEANRADVDDAEVVADLHSRFANADAQVMHWVRGSMRDISNRADL